MGEAVSLVVRDGSSSLLFIHEYFIPRVASSSPTTSSLSRALLHPSGFKQCLGW
ncbi:hypothetical protein LINPERPRIM_LOCUS7955 [Linum perenne]